MNKTKTNLSLLFLMMTLILVACGGTEPATEPAAAPGNGEQTETAVVTEPEEMMTETDNHADADMADADMADDDMADDDMADDDMADEMMDDTGHDAAEMAATESDSHDEMAGESEMEAASDGMMAETGMEEETAVMIDRPAWHQISLTDVRTSESFTLADFAGKTVFVEPMATWCTNCRRQLGNVQQARSLVSEDVVFIALSVETNISDADLATYTNNTGFDWTFAVATPELLQGLVDAFGRTALNPPSTPHFIIRPDGSMSDLVIGIDPADDIVIQIQTAQDS